MMKTIQDVMFKFCSWKYFYMFFKERMHLFDQKYNTNIIKYYYNLQKLFST